MIHYSRGIYAIFMSCGLLQSCNHLVHQMDPNNPQGSIPASDSANQAQGSTSQNGRLLFAAVQRGDKTTVEDLLIKVNPNTVKDKDGNTLLHVVKDPDVARRLIDAKADLNAANSQQWTALHVAAHENNVRLIDVLIQAGAKVDSRNDWGWTALHLAVQSERLEAMKLLIAYGADLHAEANLGFSMQDGGITPLHLAALLAKKEALKVLLACPVEVNAKAIYGFTPLDMAALSSNQKFRELFPGLEQFFNILADANECIRELENAGADKEAISDLGQGYTHLAEISEIPAFIKDSFLAKFDE